MIIIHDPQAQINAECVFYWKAEAGLGLFLLWGSCSLLQWPSCKSRTLTSTGIKGIIQCQHFLSPYTTQECWSITVNNQTDSGPDNLMTTLEKW